MTPVLVFGTDGQVSQALREILPDAIFVAREDCDFEKPGAITGVLERFRPGLIINPSAYTAVDQAESEPERARRVNAGAVAEIAAWCARAGASLVHYSTDYVYDGGGEVPWRESDPAAPCNLYGQSKLEGEEAVRASGCHHIILRTSWVVSPAGKNFVLTMLRLGREREGLRVVADQIGAPTSALDLARATAKITTHPNFKRHSGVYNLANSGFTSWCEFAGSIFEQWRALGHPLAVQRIEPISSDQYPTPARRPRNSRLDMSRVRADFQVEMRPWQDALREILNRVTT